ncbi:MAG: hypothetical protein ACYTJ0_05945 [Planctomycetota bacterium]
MTTTANDEPARRVLRWVWRTHGLWLVLTGLVAGIGGYIVTGRLTLVASEAEIVLAPWLAAGLAGRGWIALPAVAIAACGILTGRGRWPWLWLGLGALLVLLLCGALLACFVGVMAPLYDVGGGLGPDGW